MCMCTYINIMSVFVAGACDREGVSYQRVHADDGSETVGVVDYLVHQTAPLHVHLGGCLHHPIQGGR